MFFVSWDSPEVSGSSWGFRGVPGFSRDPDVPRRSRVSEEARGVLEGPRVPGWSPGSWGSWSVPGFPGPGEDGRCRLWSFVFLIVPWYECCGLCFVGCLQWCLMEQ